MNMDYCKFENTVSAINQIKSAIEEKGAQHQVNEASSYELAAIRDFIYTIETLVDDGVLEDLQTALDNGAEEEE